MEDIRADDNIKTYQQVYGITLAVSTERCYTYMTLWRCILLRRQFHADQFAADLFKFYESGIGASSLLLLNFLINVIGSHSDLQ